MRKILLSIALLALMVSGGGLIKEVSAETINPKISTNIIDVKRAALEEIVKLKNLGNMSTNSKEFKEVILLMNKINESTTNRQIELILLDIEGTNLNNDLINTRKSAIDEIINLTNLGSLSSNSKEFADICATIEKIQKEKDNNEIKNILEKLKIKIELNKVKQEAYKKVANTKNLGNIPTDSKEFNEILNLLDQIENAITIDEVNHLVNNFLK